jgi:hypothetical protein
MNKKNRSILRGITEGLAFGCISISFVGLFLTLFQCKFQQLLLFKITYPFAFIILLGHICRKRWV